MFSAKYSDKKQDTRNTNIQLEGAISIKKCYKRCRSNEFYAATQELKNLSSVNISANFGQLWATNITIIINITATEQLHIF